MQLPTDPHDFALWLFDNLEELSPVGDTALWEGKLPADIDFATVESHLENLDTSLAGACRTDTRVLEFYPSHVHVYENIEQLLGNASNRKNVPLQFTLRDINFAYPSTNDSSEMPEQVSQYMDSVRLFSVLSKLSDVQNGGLLFVQSHDAQLTIIPELSSEDLRSLTSFPSFAAEFSNEESHAEQKRSIVRSVLIEQFRPCRSVPLSDVIDKFDEIARDARHSLAMYMAEFSVAKVKSEVERQNLDDTLSLSKTLSEIQNQLLALPAAILLAGATIKIGETLRNYAVLAGIVIFTIFILILVSNQRHSIDAISAQITRRKEKIKNMPSDSSAEVLPLFEPLESRVAKQKRTLCLIKYVILAVVALAALAVIGVSHEGVVASILEWARACIEIEGDINKSVNVEP